MRYVVEVGKNVAGERTWTVFFNGETEGHVFPSKAEADAYAEGRVAEADEMSYEFIAPPPLPQSPYRTRRRP